VIWASVDIISTPKSGAAALRGYLRHPGGLRAPSNIGGGTFRHPPSIGGACAFDAKKGLRRRRKMLVSCFQEGGKKKFEKMDFWF
jgi:hypothetical protein